MADSRRSPAGADGADLGILTGVRSGKRSFYPAYRRNAERLELTVRALDQISQALVRTVEGPRALLEAVVRAAAEHLQAPWLLLAVADGALRAARPSFLFWHNGKFVDREVDLPPEVREQLHTVRLRPWEIGLVARGDSWVRVPMTLEEEPVGGVIGWLGTEVDIADTDLAILRVLANQAAVALHNSFLFEVAADLRGRTEQLSEAAARQARHLAERDAELSQLQRRLVDAMQRQVLDDERHRISRELHDSVSQHVLSAGMTIELCRSDLEDLGPDGVAVARRLETAKNLTRRAVEQLRAAIYALHHHDEEHTGPLPEMLRQLSSVHLPTDLTVQVKTAGQPVGLAPAAEHALLRITGEALFNAATHAGASTAIVRLAYAPDRVVLSVSDDGAGDPAQLRSLLRLTSTTDRGRHWGLANMATRAREFGGTLAIRRARIGGVTIRVALPLPLPDTKDVEW
ncbi:MAG: MadS family sensor histidine kinase [Sciscionella sp.]